MIADAIHEADPKARYVCVDLQSVRWSNLETGQRFVCFTPPKAQASLLLFDNGIKPKPFSCTVHSAIIKKVGWKATHPHTDETKRKRGSYRKTGIKGLKGPKPARYRQFGIRMFSK